MRFCVIYIYLFIFTIQRRDYYFFFFLINYNVREWFSTVGVINNEQKKFTYEKKIQIQGQFISKIHQCSYYYVLCYNVYYKL